MLKKKKAALVLKQGLHSRPINNDSLGVFIQPVTDTSNYQRLNSQGKNQYSQMAIELVFDLICNACTFSAVKR